MYKRQIIDLVLVLVLVLEGLVLVLVLVLGSLVLVLVLVGLVLVLVLGLEGQVLVNITGVYLVLFPRYGELFVKSRLYYLPYLHLAPSLGVIQFEFQDVL